jgi:uncharacterized protein YndB with AHSA1/START domain
MTDQSPSADRKFTITRVYDAPRRLVFDAWTRPELLAQWWGPHGFDTPPDKVSIDLRVGGRFEKVMVLKSEEIAAGMKMPVGSEFPDNVEFIEVVPPDLLVMKSKPQPEMGLVVSTTTRVEFHDEGGERTRVVLSDGPYTEQMGGYAEQGWSESFEKLERLLAGLVGSGPSV